jgi:hypothetical protein
VSVNSRGAVCDQKTSKLLVPCGRIGGWPCECKGSLVKVREGMQRAQVESAGGGRTEGRADPGDSYPKISEWQEGHCHPPLTLILK